MTQESMFLAALVYLGAAVVVVPLMQRLGLGSVLGYLVAGILVGPSVLGLVGHESKQVLEFAEFGVVLMLFVVGLELQPAVLWRLRSAIVGLGGLQVALTSVVVAGVAWATGFEGRTALTWGLIAAGSSTAMVLQTLGEKGRLGTAVGQRSFAILLFQDLTVIPLLALFPLLALSGAAEAPHGSLIAQLPAWAQASAVLGAVLAVVLAGRFLGRPAFRLVAATRIPELFTAFVLFLVIGITVLMNLVGLSPALGTFLAGVVLAGSEYRHELEGDIAPFKGLLLGVFFIAVGSTLHFQALVGDLPFLIPAVLAVMGLKTLVLLTIGAAFRHPAKESLSLALSLSQVGEFAFVLVGVAGGLGLLDPLGSTRLMAVVALSMALTPLLMVLDERVFQPLFPTAAPTQGKADKITEEHPVIIAGFDRFGNIVGRFLRANGVEATVLDDDADRIDVLRRMGLRVYYGDASRRELLEAAGAGRARILVVCLPEPERCFQVVELARRHFPHLKILARAVDRGDAYRLLNEPGVEVYRETLDTSLRVGRDVLKALGHRTHQGVRASQLFLKHDEKALRRLAEVHKDGHAYIRAARAAIAELEELIRSEGTGSLAGQDAAWDVSSLRDEVRSLYGVEAEEDKP